MADYGDFIDEGTKGAKKRGSGGNKMVNSLENWIQQRPSLSSVAAKWQTTYKDKGVIKQRKTKISFDEAKKSLTLVIKRNIHNRGIIKRFGYKGSKFFTNVINDGRVQKLEKEIGAELGKEIKIVFTKGILNGKI